MYLTITQEHIDRANAARAADDSTPELICPVAQAVLDLHIEGNIQWFAGPTSLYLPDGRVYNYSSRLIRLVNDWDLKQLPLLHPGRYRLTLNHDATEHNREDCTNG